MWIYSKLYVQCYGNSLNNQTILQDKSTQIWYNSALWELSGCVCGALSATESRSIYFIQYIYSYSVKNTGISCYFKNKNEMFLTF